jgi:hypothetical protein
VNVVTKRGVAPVIGSPYVTIDSVVGECADEPAAIAARQAVARDLVAVMGYRPRVNGRTADGGWTTGASGLLVQLAADKHYRALGLEPLVGIESGGSWSRSPSVDRSDTDRVGRHSLAAIAASGTVYGAQTVSKHRTRVKLRGISRDGARITLKPRQGETFHEIREPFVCHPDGTVVVGRIHLAAPHVDIDRIWRGHTLTARPARAGAQSSRLSRRSHVRRAASDRKRARLINPGSRDAIVCDSPEAIATAAEAINRGESVALRVNGHRVTLTRGTTYAASFGGKVKRVKSIRTADGIAAAILKSVGTLD